MYSILQLKSNIRVPPSLLGKELKDAVKAAINREFAGKVSKEGFFLSVLDVKGIGQGTIIPGDGAIYYETTFDILAYKPLLQEVVDGEISEVTEFGVFIRMGPIDGLVHVSQVMDDYVNYANTGILTGKESKRALKAKDTVRARVIAISLKSFKGAKLGLTMRQPGLGKHEWIEADKKAAAAPVEEKKPRGKGNKEEKEAKGTKRKR
jgi:DNA-directed RNA polymerase subunit E'